MTNQSKSSKTFSIYKGFTILEIIFVIVMIGILAFVGRNFIPDNRLLSDTKYVIMKIREKQKNAIGYTSANFGENIWSIDENTTCIDIDKDTLNLEAKESNSEKKYFIISDIEVTGSKRVCFDSLGRPYIPEEKKILLRTIDINLTKNGMIKNIKLYPYSGYVTIIK